MAKFDVTFKSGGPSIDYHFCREVNCFGTNDAHGYSFDKAKDIAVRYLEEELRMWRAMSFEDWRRSNYPTKEEVNEFLSTAGDLYALQEKAQLTRDR